MKKIIIDDFLFAQFPDFKRGVIIVSDINNSLINEIVEKSLGYEIEKRRGTDFSNHEFVKSWEDVHLKFGSNPNKYPPSIKSLLKRIHKGGSFPFINSTVALFNYISIKYLIPCGGDDVEKIKGNLKLGFAKGNEIFIPLGSEEPESPETKEVIYFDDKDLNVMCRRWNWRNGNFTKITEHSKKIVINIDGIGPISRTQIEEARDELAKLLIGYCGAKLTKNYLDKNNHEIDTFL